MQNITVNKALPEDEGKCTKSTTVPWPYLLCFGLLPFSHDSVWITLEYHELRCSHMKPWFVLKVADFKPILLIPGQVTVQ